VKQISGKRKTHNIRYLITENGTRIDDPWKMANELATQFTKTSDNTQYTQESRRKKDREEKTPIQVNCENEEPYNRPLTEEEMDEALSGCAGFSPGPDHIHCEFMKKMARPEKMKILNASRSQY
jgi:hypothetical protein